MAGSMSPRKACSATRVPVSLPDEQWLGKDKNTSRPIPSGDGSNGSVQEVEVAQPFLQPRSLGKSYKTTQPCGQNTNIPATPSGGR